MSALFAATYPERTAALILDGAFADGSYLVEQSGAKFLEIIGHHWGWPVT